MPWRKRQIRRTTRRTERRRDPMKSRFGLLNHDEMERMRDALASGPLIYKPSVDNRLINIGMLKPYDDPDPNKFGVEPTSMANKDFYDDSGSVRPRFFDFDAQGRAFQDRKNLKSKHRTGLRWYAGDAARQRAEAKMRPGEKLWRFEGTRDEAQMATGDNALPLYAVSKKRPISGETMLKFNGDDRTTLWKEE